MRTWNVRVVLSLSHIKRNLIWLSNVKFTNQLTPGNYSKHYVRALFFWGRGYKIDQIFQEECDTTLFTKMWKVYIDYGMAKHLVEIFPQPTQILWKCLLTLIFQCISTAGKVRKLYTLLPVLRQKITRRNSFFRTLIKTSNNSYPVLIDKITWQKGEGKWRFLDMYNKGNFPHNFHLSRS